MDALKPEWIINSIVFSVIGVFMFWLMFILIDKITPYNLWKEIIEKHNQSLAIVVAAMCLGIALIVASAVHG